MYRVRKIGQPDAEVRTFHMNMMLLCNDLPLEENEDNPEPACTTPHTTPNSITKSKHRTTKHSTNSANTNNKDDEESDDDSAKEENEFQPLQLQELKQMFEKKKNSSEWKSRH